MAAALIAVMVVLTGCGNQPVGADDPQVRRLARAIEATASKPGTFSMEVRENDGVSETCMRVTVGPAKGGAREWGDITVWNGGPCGGGAPAGHMLIHGQLLYLHTPHAPARAGCPDVYSTHQLGGDMASSLLLKGADPAGLSQLTGGITDISAKGDTLSFSVDARRAAPTASLPVKGDATLRGEAVVTPEGGLDRLTLRAVPGSVAVEVRVLRPTTSRLDLPKSVCTTAGPPISSEDDLSVIAASQ